MSISTVARPLVVLALVGALAGCVVHERAADVTFLWDFGGVSCSQAGVRSIDVVLEDLDDGSIDEVDGVPCETGGVTLEDLDPSPYTVTFYGDGYLLLQEGVRLRGGDNEFQVHLPVNLGQ